MMKKLLVLLLAPLCTTAWALPLAYDGFNYPLSPTNLTAQTPDGPWKDAGAAASITNRPYMSAGSLSYPGLAPSVGNSITFGGRGMSAHLDFPSSSYIYSNTVYYSFILKVNDLGKLPTSGIFFAAITGGNFTGSEPTLLVAGLVAKKVGPTQYVLGVKKAGGGIVYTNGSNTEITNSVGDTVFVVASYEFVTYPGGKGDIARLWINPDSSSFGAGAPPAEDALSTGSNDLGTSGYPLNGFTFYNRQLNDEPGSITADELTVGTSWADVTPTASALAFISQPKGQRTIAGGEATFSASAYRATTYQWQHNGTDIPDATDSTLSLSSVQLSDAGTYHLVIGNGVNSLTSTDVTLTVYPDIYPRLVPLWSLAPGSRPYITTDGTTSPNQRGFAYNSLSNQVLLVSRTNSTFDGITNAAIYVLDGNSGADLYQMNADPNTISGGVDVNGGGTNFLTLNYIDVADDGAVYAANVGNDASPFKLYRWDNSGSNAAPVAVWIGDPSGQSPAPRFGDSFAVRGSGDSTQVMLDDTTGKYGALLSVNPGGSPGNPFDWTYGFFNNAALGQTGGRTLLFFGSTNTFWEKHGSGTLNLVTYDTTFGVQSSSLLTNYPNLVGNPGLLAFSSDTNQLFAIHFAGSSSSAPDTLDQYDYSDPSKPLFIRSYNFPVSHQPNGNGCGRVVVSGDRVYALDSNNGMVAFRIAPNLSITPAGGSMVLSWSALTPGYTLQATPSLSSPTVWTNVSAGTLVGDQYFVTNSAAAGTLFYRLQK